MVEQEEETPKAQEGEPPATKPEIEAPLDAEAAPAAKPKEEAPPGPPLTPEEIQKKERIENRKKELRAKMEEASQARRAKKGFMTPDKKKRLAALLRKQAAEALKAIEEARLETRAFIIHQRCGYPEDVEIYNDPDIIIQICQDYWERLHIIEDQKWEMERAYLLQTFQVHDISLQVTELPGRFQKPILRKVPKYDKFAKLQKKAAEFIIKDQLKVVRKPEFSVKDDDKKRKGTPLVPAEKVGAGEGPGAEGSAAKGKKGKEGAAQEVKPPGEGDSVKEPSPPPPPPSPPPPPVSEPIEPPPPPPEPEHTEEELWMYIKESVTNACPMTIEELVQKMIDCVQAVPQGYLKPVVEASIRRTQSLDLGGLALGEGPKEGEGQTAEDTQTSAENPVPAEVDTLAPDQDPPPTEDGAPATLEVPLAAEATPETEATPAGELAAADVAAEAPTAAVEDPAALAEAESPTVEAPSAPVESVPPATEEVAAPVEIV